MAAHLAWRKARQLNWGSAMKPTRAYIGLLVFGGGILSACSDDNTTAVDRRYQAAGSRWELSATDSTFTLREYASLASTTVSATVSGTVAQNATNRFKTYTISATDVADAGAPGVGSTVSVLEIPNSVAFIQPPNGEANPLVATVIGTCPSVNFSANWAVTKPQLDGGAFQQGNFDTDGVGTAVFTAANDRFLVRASGIVGGVLQSEGAGSEFLPIGMGTCSNGRLNVTASGEQFDMYFTASGQIVVKFPDAMGNQIISGLPATNAAVTAPTVAGTYSVFVYRSAAAANLSDATLRPAKLTFDASGNGQLRIITDVAANTEAGTDELTLSGFTNQDNSAGALANGLFRLTIGGGPVGQLSCATSDATPRPLICYGFTGTSPNRRPITIVGHIR